MKKLSRRKRSNQFPYFRLGTSIDSWSSHWENHWPRYALGTLGFVVIAFTLAGCLCCRRQRRPKGFQVKRLKLTPPAFQALSHCSCFRCFRTRIKSIYQPPKSAKIKTNKIKFQNDICLSFFLSFFQL